MKKSKFKNNKIKLIKNSYDIYIGFQIPNLNHLKQSKSL